jgi:hypothetical protein
MKMLENAYFPKVTIDIWRRPLVYELHSNFYLQNVRRDVTIFFKI